VRFSAAPGAAATTSIEDRPLGPLVDAHLGAAETSPAADRTSRWRPARLAWPRLFTGVFPLTVRQEAHA
jgi:hypothetical protein